VKRCSKCGEDKPLDAFVRDKRRTDGRGTWCKPCATAYARQKYNSDLDKSRAQKRAYVAANREELNAKAAERLRQWRKDNPELARQKATEKSQKFREANPDYHRGWYERNIEREQKRSRQVMANLRRDRPELEREWKRRYREKNAEVVKEREREKTYARRARQPNSPELARLMADLVKQACVYCGSVENITIDHIVPLSRGGKHEASNLAPACFSCNSSKCNRLLSEWSGRAAA
jgi:5-methylcytosine-specific restriction endonuclease McrA